MGCKPLDKKHKKGLWSPDEDEKLKTYILNYGHGCWSSVPTNAGLKRNGKSCRLRWINYLRPGLKRGAFSLEEEEIILTLHRILGNKWSNIAHHLPGRTDNEIKNHWHSYLKKRPVSKMVATDQAHPKIECMINNEQLPGFELPPSSSKSSTPQNSSFDSFESMEASLMDTDDQSIATQNCNLPKLLFAEWLCLDQFHSHNSESNYSSAAVHSNSEDSLDHGLLFNESNTVSVDDMLPLPFQFEDQMSQSGLVDYFPGEFVINCDDMYI